VLRVCEIQVQKTVFVVVFLLLLALSGCASPGKVSVVQPGDIADIHYLCTLKTGEIVAATDSVAENQPKSNIFIASKEPGPLSLKAAGPDESLPEKQDPSLEEEIRDQIARVVVGMKEGESRHVELTAQEAPVRDEENYVTHLARVRKRPKEMKMTVSDYRLQTGKAPEVGQPFTREPAFPGRVEAVTDQDVVIQFFAKNGDVMETPFGPGRIHEDENSYLVDIDARKGSLVRTGSMVGRITNVDDKVITVDYRNDFGGETLTCDVAVKNVKEPESVKSVVGNSDR